MKLSDFVRESRKPEIFGGAVWVSLCSSLFALGIGVLVWTRSNFNFYEDSGVYGWVAANNYPKQQEFLAYIGSFLCIIFGILSGWLLWCSLASLYHRFRCSSLSRSLRRTSIVFSGFFLAAFPLFLADWRPLPLFLFPLAIVTAATVAVFAFRETASFWQLGHSIRILIEGTTNRPARKGFALPRFKLPLLRKRWHLLLVWIVTPILLYLYLYDGSAMHGRLDLFHEGELLGPLNAMLHGGFPYRDIYVQHGLCNVVKPWLILSLGNPSLASLRFFDTLLQPLTFIVLYFLGIQVFRSWFTTIALVLLASSTYMTSMSVHHLGMDRSLLPLMSLTFLVYGIPRSYEVSPNHANRAQKTILSPCFGAAGVLSTIAIFYSTESGLYVFASCALFLGFYAFSRPTLNAFERFIPLVNYFGGVLVALIPICTFLWMNGALGDMIKNTYIQCAYQIAAWGLPFPSFPNNLKTITSFADAKRAFRTFQFYLPICVYLATVGLMTVRIMRGNLWNNRSVVILLLILLFGMAQMRTALGRSDVSHLYYGILPVWILILFFIENNISLFLKSMEGKGAVAGKAVPFLLLFVLFFILCYPVYQMFRAHVFHASKIMKGDTIPRFYDIEWERIGSVNIGQTQLAHLRRVVDFIQTNTTPNEPIFDFSNSGAIYFLANRHSATRYHQVAYAVTPDIQRQVIEDLIRTDTRLVIYGTDGFDGIPNFKRHPLIAHYIDTHYERRLSIDGTLIFLR